MAAFPTARSEAQWLDVLRYRGCAAALLALDDAICAKPTYCWPEMVGVGNFGRTVKLPPLRFAHPKIRAPRGMVWDPKQGVWEAAAGFDMGRAAEALASRPGTPKTPGPQYTIPVGCRVHIANKASYILFVFNPLTCANPAHNYLASSPSYI